MTTWLRFLLPIFASLLLLAGCSSEKKHPSLPAGSVVLAFGDSVTHGTGAGPGEDYPTQLAALTRWDIRNAGIPGDTAEAAKSRIAAALEETRPALVIVEIGGNDFLRRRPEAAVKEDIRRILEQIRSAGVPAILVAVPRFSVIGAATGNLPDSGIYAELAKEEKLPLVADVFAETLSDPALRADAVHPNAAGYKKLAAGIAETLTKAGFLAR